MNGRRERPRPRWLRWLPRGLFARTLLIIVVPMVLAQSVAVVVFFDRHYDAYSTRLAQALGGEIRLLVEAVRSDPATLPRQALLAYDYLALRLDYMPNEPLPEIRKPALDPLLPIVRRSLAEAVPYPLRINRFAGPGWVEVYVQLPDGLVVVGLPERRIFTPTTYIFIGWMVGSAVLLSLIAILFMRNQVRPIRRLAAAAEAFGRNQDASDFKPEGALEVRAAARALLQMRDRLRRFVADRTAMLAGISHDLRTPLTRMRLQLALLPDSSAVQELQADIREMEDMVSAYLAFARGADAEQPAPTDLAALVAQLAQSARRGGMNVSLLTSEAITHPVRPLALRRALMNLLDNAGRYGTRIGLMLQRRGGFIELLVDDDGPGIPAVQRDEVLRPFTRLDESRNSETGGVGLGLTIARDVARLHGGDLLLQDSPWGGLRALVRLPA